MASFLEEFLRSLSAEYVTNLFIFIILAMLVVAIYQAFTAKHTQYLDHAPSLLTSVGILGTFVGIVIGLLDFNTKQIDASIGTLLEGLKTAFLTSLVGMLASIFFKVVDSWIFEAKREEGAVKGDVTPEDIYNVISEGNGDLKNINDSISASEEGSLLGQIKLLRSDVVDFQKDSKTSRDEFNEILWMKLDEFAEMISKTATEQVIEALKQVIVEFNEKLTEQFGDNFKRLDESVKKLVEWQQMYMLQLEEMSSQYNEGVKAIEGTRDAVSVISEKTEEIPKSMDNLKSVLEVNQHQISELQRHLEAFVNMRDKAIEAVPQIQGQIENVGAQLVQGAENMKAVMIEGTTEFNESVSKTNAAMNEMANHVNTQSEQIAVTLKETSEEINSTSRDMLERLSSGASSLQDQLDNTVESVLASLRDGVNQMLSGAEQQISNTVSRTGEAVNEQLSALDEALQTQLNRAMEELGRALATIANHIVDVYQERVPASH